MIYEDIVAATGLPAFIHERSCGGELYLVGKYRAQNKTFARF
jgi:hypothetical protein